MNRLLTTLFLLLAGFSNGHAGNVSANNAILNEYDQEPNRQRLLLLLPRYGITILQLITQPITTNMRQIFTQRYVSMYRLANRHVAAQLIADNSAQARTNTLPLRLTILSSIN